MSKWAVYWFSVGNENPYDRNVLSFAGRDKMWKKTEITKNVATPCADMYAAVDLAIATRPLQCAAGKAVGERATRDIRHSPQVFTRDSRNCYSAS